MLPFDIENIKLNPKAIKPKITEEKERFIANEDLFIIFYNRFYDRDLVFIEEKVRLLGLFIIVDSKGNYAKVMLPNFINMSPNMISDVSIQEKEYTVLHFYKGNDIVSERKLIKNDDFTFNIFEDFFINGNIPFFMSYDDMVKFFLKVRKFANSNLVDNPKGIEVLTSIIGRNRNDTKKYIRQTIKSKDDITEKSMKFISLSNITEGYNNTISKITGAYLKEGIVSAIVDPETQESDLTKILKK